VITPPNLIIDVVGGVTSIDHEGCPSGFNPGCHTICEKRAQFLV
jgi:hypothetical protein